MKCEKSEEWEQRSAAGARLDLTLDVDFAEPSFPCGFEKVARLVGQEANLAASVSVLAD